MFGCFDSLKWMFRFVKISCMCCSVVVYLVKWVGWEFNMWINDVARSGCRLFNKSFYCGGDGIELILLLVDV